MFKELTEYGKNIREEMKVMLSEIKPTGYQEHHRIKPTVLEHKEGKSIQSEQQEEIIILKNEDRLRNLWDFKHTNI